MLTRQELLDSVTGTYARNVDIMRKKNNDYATNEDALSNFKIIQNIGVVDDYKSGILMRMTDKFARITNILKKGKADVMDETVEDTLADLCNYAAILRAALEDEKRINDPAKKAYEETFVNLTQ
jgi:hypothetical protein